MTDTKDDTKQFRGASRSRKDVLDYYFGDVREHDLIDVERERELGRRAQEGDEAAVRKLAEANLRFAIQVAKKYQGRGVSLRDLIQEANVGLLKAARKFDPEKGVKFISYAVWWIRQSILAALANHSRPVRVPLNRNTDLANISRARSELVQELGRKPTVEEIAAATDLRPEEVEDLQALNYGPVRFDAPIGDDEGNEELLGRFEVDEAIEPEHEAEGRILSQRVSQALETLNPRDAKVLRLYYGLEDGRQWTLQEIGDLLGVTRERVRQLRNRAMKRLREGEWGSALATLAA